MVFGRATSDHTHRDISCTTVRRRGIRNAAAAAAAAADVDDVDDDAGDPTYYSPLDSFRDYLIHLIIYPIQSFTYCLNVPSITAAV